MNERRASDPLYWLLRFLFRLAFRVFFARITVLHPERIPKGPLIFASNHPNDLIDPLLIGTIAPMRIDFVAKNTLFSVGPLGSIFRRFGVIPVYRREDADPEEIEAFMEKNKAMFETCRERLLRGGAIAMFPEGVSHRDPHVKQLKTGTARIALESEAARGFRLGAMILPVGLSFSRWNRFRSEVLIRFGRPIQLSFFRELYEREPEEAVRRLTAAIEGGMRALTFHTEEAELAALARAIHEIFSSRMVPIPVPPSRLYREKEILEAIHYFQKTDPKWFLAFRDRIERYHNRLVGLGIRDRVMARKKSPLFPITLLLRELLIGLAGLPFFLFGVVNNYLPYRLPTIIAGRMRELDADGTVKFISGFLLFPLFYTSQTLGVGLLYGPRIALGYAISLPPTGLFAFRYWIWLRRSRNSLFLALLHLTRRGLLRELRVEREALIADIERRQEIFLKARSKNNGKLEGSREKRRPAQKKEA